MNLANPVVRGLIWGDWKRFRIPLLVLPVLLAVMWILIAPGTKSSSTDLNFAFAFLGVSIAATFGIFPGADVRDGTEEFVMALPPRRSTRFLVRLGVGLLLITGVQILGWLTLVSEWPWRFWDFLPVSIPDSFSDPPGSVPAGHPGHVLFGFVAPLAVFASAFCSGMMRRPGKARFILEPALAIMILFAAYFWIKPVLTSWPGVVCSACLLLFAGSRIVIGYRDYHRKEAGGSTRSAGARDPVSVVIRVLIALALLALLGMGALAFLLLQSPAR